MINMLCFKKKYKKSEWMEGLLWAEKTLAWYSPASEHLFVVDEDGLEGYEILGRGTSREKPHTIKRCSREFGKGVIDYIEHKDNSLNN